MRTIKICDKVTSEVYYDGPAEPFLQNPTMLDSYTCPRHTRDGDHLYWHGPNHWHRWPPTLEQCPEEAHLDEDLEGWEKFAGPLEVCYCRPLPPASIAVTSLKMAREALCAAEHAMFNTLNDPQRVALIGAMIADIDRQRPLGPDGKHGDHHTDTCGCTDLERGR